jgi:hypothetical protein
MAYVSGPYGIQYEDRSSNNESHRVRWILTAVLVLVAVSFACVKIKNATSSGKNPPAEKLKETIIKKEEPSRIPEIKAPMKNVKIPTKNIPPAPPLIPEGTEKNAKLNAPSDPTVELDSSITKTQILKRDPWSVQVNTWLESAETRSTTDRNLLERLSTAVREKKISLEIDSLEKLCRRPTLVDIKDPMLRRLGELNMKRFLSK